MKFVNYQIEELKFNTACIERCRIYMFPPIIVFHIMYVDFSGHLQEVRPMPSVTLSGGYIMCAYVTGRWGNYNRGCRKGDRCSFAHFKLKVKAWNRAKKNQNRGQTRMYAHTVHA